MEADPSLLARAIPEWLELVSLAFCMGAIVCLLWVVAPQPGDGTSDRERVVPALRDVLGFATVALLATSALGLLVRSAEMSGSPLAEGFAALPTVVLRTHIGHAWVLRIAAILSLSLMILAARRFHRSRSFQYAMLGCTLIVCALGSASGHASDAGDFNIPEMIDWLHLVGAMVWGGGLLVLSTAILPGLVKQGSGAVRAIADIAARFSTIAGFAMAFVAVTAVYQERAYAGSVQSLAGSDYGRIVIAKIVLFLLLLLLGAFNRYIHVPRLRDRARATEEPGALLAARFRFAVALEALLIVAVLLCAALLRHEMPSRHTGLRATRAEQTSAR